ncbi:MAG: nucleotidyltransferase domain-containing protein [Coriobacteriales bacterium]|jgi:DNA-binding transcriptional ArsR family regulator|nr:nucleotidyltransferase domain-containing protein [Coriobacteriales bacterium]
MITNEDILGSKSSIGVLRVLEGVSVALSITQIARQAGLTRPAVVSVLERLEQKGIVFVTRSGNARLYQLEPTNIYVEQVIRPFFEFEQNLLGHMKRDISQALGSSTTSIILFGSFAREDQDQSSDVDIVVVAKDSLQRKQVEKSLDEYGSCFYRRFGHGLDALVYDYAQARQLSSRAPALFTEIKEDGCLISGTAEWMTSEQE